MPAFGETITLVITLAESKVDLRVFPLSCLFLLVSTWFLVFTLQRRAFIVVPKWSAHLVRYATFQFQ